MEVLAALVLALAALAGLIAAALFVPADYALSAGTRRPFRLRVRWLFGLVRIGEPSEGRVPREPSPEERDETGRRVERARRTRKARTGKGAASLRNARAARRVLAIEGLADRFARLLRDLVRTVGWKRAHLGLRLGTGDPAETGWICAFAYPLLVWVPRSPAFRFDFEPDFDEPAFDFAADGAGTLVPARVVGALGRFAFSPQGLRVIKVMVWDRRR